MYQKQNSRTVSIQTLSSRKVSIVFPVFSDSSTTRITDVLDICLRREFSFTMPFLPRYSLTNGIRLKDSVYRYLFDIINQYLFPGLVVGLFN